MATGRRASDLDTARRGESAGAGTAPGGGRVDAAADGRAVPAGRGMSSAVGGGGACGCGSRSCTAASSSPQASCCSPSPTRSPCISRPRIRSSPFPRGRSRSLLRYSSTAGVKSSERSALLHGLLLRSGLALALMAAVSVWLGWLMAGRVLRPLRTITATTRQISEENLHQRLALAGPADELQELGDTIDGLLGRLEGAFDAQRSFVANASHELRTPLASMRVAIDVATRKSPPVSRTPSILAGRIREDLGQADRILESLLVLARAQRGVVTDLKPVSLTSGRRGGARAPLPSRCRPRHLRAQHARSGRGDRRRRHCSAVWRQPRRQRRPPQRQRGIRRGRGHVDGPARA